MSKRTKYRYFTASGSNSLDSILSIEGVTENVVIWLPYLICKDVLDVVYNYTRKTRFYLTDKELNPIGLEEICDNQLVILVNYFGFPQNSELIEQLKSKCIVIEDNSHGLFGKSADGKKLGTRGNYGLVSIWKTLYVPNGGILYSSKLVNRRIGVDYSFPIYFFFKLVIRLLSLVGNTNILRFYRKEFKPKIAGLGQDNFQIKLIYFYSLFIYKLSIPFFVRYWRRLKYKLVLTRLNCLNLDLVFPVLDDHVCPYGVAFYCSDCIILDKVDYLCKVHGFLLTRWPDLDTSVSYPEEFSVFKDLHFINLKRMI